MQQQEEAKVITHTFADGKFQVGKCVMGSNCVVKVKAALNGPFVMHDNVTVAIGTKVLPHEQLHSGSYWAGVPASQQQHHHQRKAKRGGK